MGHLRDQNTKLTKETEELKEKLKKKASWQNNDVIIVSLVNCSDK